MTNSARIRPTEELFRIPLRGGVYRYIGPTFDTLEALRGVGWTAGHVRQGDTLEEFLTEVGRALEFTGYQGCSIHELWYHLRQLKQPTALLWTSWHEIAIERPYDWAAITELLEERASHEPTFALVLG